MRGSVTTVQASDCTRPALVEVATAVLQIRPRCLAVNVTAWVFDSPGARSPNGKESVGWPLLCVMPFGTVSVTTMPRATVEPVLRTTML